MYPGVIRYMRYAAFTCKCKHCDDTRTVRKLDPVSFRQSESGDHPTALRTFRKVYAAGRDLLSGSPLCNCRTFSLKSVATALGTVPSAGGPAGRAGPGRAGPGRAGPGRTGVNSADVVRCVRRRVSLLLLLPSCSPSRRRDVSTHFRNDAISPDSPLTSRPDATSPSFQSTHSRLTKFSRHVTSSRVRMASVRRSRMSRSIVLASVLCSPPAVR